MPDWACVNGVFSPVDRATISINDRGLLFADSVYEVMLARDGLVIAGARHLARLARSLDAICISADLELVRRWVGETLLQSQLASGLLYLQVTRGTAPRQHLPAAGMTPNVIVTARQWAPIADSVRRQGVRVITTLETRWARRDIKTTNLLPNMLAKQQAAGVGAYEALFVDADGAVNEASSSNVFAVIGQTLVTPPCGHAILPGVTRDIVVELARESGRTVEERRLPRNELLAADEVFLSGTTTAVLGVTRVDETTIGPGEVGPVTRSLYESYLSAEERLA
jgi:D-alanine transaminase